jgi:hypothetical protein
MNQQTGDRPLHICVEGPDDYRFFANVVCPRLEQRYALVRLVRYAEWKRSKLTSFLRHAAKMGDVIYAADINDAPCVTAKKQAIHRELGNAIAGAAIVVVVREIEGWYLAGLDQRTAKEIGGAALGAGSTDDVSKEKFEALQPRRFDLKVDFMMEILARFALDAGRARNASFRYFCAKYSL